MKDIGYKLLKGLLTLVACMPLGVLYVFSDFLLFEEEIARWFLVVELFLL